MTITTLKERFLSPDGSAYQTIGITMEELDSVIAEAAAGRDALAAHAKAMRDQLHRMATYPGDCDEEDRVYAQNLVEAAPATPLTQRDAYLLEKWAKALEQRAEYNREDGHELSARGMGAAALLLREESQRLSRQARED